MAESPWDPETEELIKRSEMMKDLGIDPMGFMIKRPPKIAPNKGGATAKRASTEARKRTSDKRTARRAALQKLRGLIPASPTN
jgi:hypothetical protein